MSVLAPSVANLWKVIESYGIDPAPLFAEEGLEFELPITPGTRVSYHKVDRVRSRAAELSDDEAFGLRTHDTLHPTHLGALGYAWLASSSLHTAFLRMHRYVRVLNDTARLDLREEGSDLVVSLGVGQDSENAQVRDDAQLSAMLTLCRMNCGADFTPSWVAFRHAPPTDDTCWKELFGCPLRFDAERNEMAIDLEDANRLLPSANPMLAQMNERIANQRLARLDANDIPNRVRAEIMDQLPSGTVSDESVAGAMHMTSRTLHRRLKRDGQSFRGLLKEVRQDLAEQYILDDSLTLTEITFLLGFSEMSSFSRAFKRWKGVSPSEARQEAIGHD